MFIYKVYPEVSELLHDIEEFEAKTSWKTALIPEMRINHIKGERLIHLEDENGFNVANLPFTDEAVASICARAEVAGRAIHRLSRDLFARHMNDYFKVAFNKCSIVNVFDGVVQATHSDGYKVLPINKLIEQFLWHVNKTYPNSVLKQYEITPTETIVDFILNDENLNKKYSEALQRKLSVSDIKPVLRFISSNTGWSGANLYPILYFKNTPWIATEPITLKHQGKASVEKFAENCEKSFSLMLEGVDKLNELSKINIEYPANCAANIAKEIGLPKKRIMPILLEMQDEYDEMSSNAREVYIYLTKILDDIEDPVAQFKMADHISRALTLDFKKYDRTKAAWFEEGSIRRYVSKDQTSLFDNVA